MSEAPHAGFQLPHLTRADFLSAEEHAALLDWTIAQLPGFTPARLAGKRIDDTSRKALVSRDLGPHRAVLERHVRAALTEWQAELRVTPFDVSGIELELAAHNDGAFFARHTDTMTRDLRLAHDRMLSAVYYFHREPRGFGGGSLILHRIGAPPGDAGIEIPPTQNSLLVFPSWAPHEVLPITCPSGDLADSRFAVNCWVCRARVDPPGDRSPQTGADVPEE